MSNNLSEELKNFGEQLLIELDKTQDKPTAMFWTRDIHPGEWVLFIALSSALEAVQRKNGNTRDMAGGRILKIIKKLRNGTDDFRFIIGSPRHSLIYALSALFATGPNDIYRAELSNNFVNGVNTGDNFIYRLHILKD